MKYMGSKSRISKEVVPIIQSYINDNNILKNKDNYDNYLVGFVGFCCSFGGKFFCGYARGYKNDGKTRRNYASESYRNLIKQASNLKDIHFNCRDFRDINANISNFVIYCDPPYSRKVIKR